MGPAGQDGRDGKDGAITLPKGWRFIVKRDQNNLLVEVLATPVNQGK